jgi:hypothetical protein
MRRIPGLALMVIGLTIAAGQALSAQTTANISGTVTDETGGVLPGATISVTNAGTGISREAITDDQGRYRVTNLNIGTYDVTADMPGFQVRERRGIALTIGRDAVVDFAMSLGGVQEDVVVTGDAPLVDTRSGSLGAVVDRETIQEIPLNGRDLTGLITLQAGTSSPKNTADGASNGYANKFSIGGSRVTDNSVLLDGTEVKSYDGGVPSGVSGNFLGGEAIQEFKVEKNAFSSEFGGTMGGVINVVSKSGTNEFHGSGYGFMRNAAMDAINARATERPEFWRAQYGASAGGRIIRNQTFYFANFEGLRERLNFPAFVNTFSASARRGILPGRTVAVKPSIVPYFDLWPLPDNAVDLGDGTARYPVLLKQPTDEDFYQIRVDHNLSASDAIFGRFTRQTSSRLTPANIDRWGGNDDVTNAFFTGEYKKIFTSRLLNTFRVGYNRRGLKQFSQEVPPVDASLFMVPPEYWVSPLGADPFMGALNVPGLTSPGLPRGFVDRYVARFQVVNGVVYSRGAHTLKFGADWSYIQMNGDNPSRRAGELNFGSIDFFLQGLPRQFRGDVLPTTDSIRHMHWNTVGSYAQYDWQVHANATVNLGLRHEFYTVTDESDGKFANLKNPYTDAEITVLGTNGDSWWENHSLKNFAPRVGVSWDPTGSGTMAVRAGFGYFHNLFQPETFRQLAWRTQPFALETNIQATEGVIPFPEGLYDYILNLGEAQGDLFVLPYSNMGNPRMAQWNVNVQREIPGNMAVTVGYAGSRGMELFNPVDLNTAVADRIDGRYVVPVGARRPNEAFDLDLSSLQTIGKSWYHGLQVELRRRFQNGWQAQLAYTFSKAIDLASQFLPTFDGGSGPGSPYVYDQQLGRGLAAFHVAQQLSGSWVWQLPSVGNGVANAIVGGWQLSGIVTLADGTPVSVGIGARSALSAVGVGAGGPDLIPGGNPNPVTGDPDKYFDVSQFVFPPTRTIGDLGRNTLIAPGLATVDMGLTKNIPIGATGDRIQFRLEVFNLLNRANWGLPATSVFNGTGRAQANAGFISSTSTPARQIQLGLRYDW